MVIVDGLIGMGDESRSKTFGHTLKLRGGALPFPAVAFSSRLNRCITFVHGEQIGPEGITLGRDFSLHSISPIPERVDSVLGRSHFRDWVSPSDLIFSRSSGATI